MTYMQRILLPIASWPEGEARTPFFNDAQRRRKHSDNSGSQTKRDLPNVMKWQLEQQPIFCTCVVNFGGSACVPETRHLGCNHL